MGRTSIIPELEQKIGKSLKSYLSEKIRDGKKPEEIAAELSIGKSAVYNFIKELGLKSLQKEVRQNITSGQSGELIQYIDKYISEKQSSGISPLTIVKDTDVWRIYTWWLDYTKKPKTLFSVQDKDTILQFFTYLDTQKNRFGKQFHKTVSKQTQQNYRKKMAAFVHWLQFNEIIPAEKTADPFAKMMKIKLPPKLPEDLPDEIVQIALDSFDNSFEGIRNKTIVSWFLETGQRRSGVHDIKMSEFNWETGIGKVIEKGSKQRTIVLSDALKEQLSIYLSKRAEIARVQSLWINSDGSAMKIYTIYKMIKDLNRIPTVKEAIARLAPGQRFHPHIFRHIWAKHLAQSDVPGYAMMIMGGWEDLALVQHYAEAYAQDKAWRFINQASPLSKFHEKQSD